MWIFTKYGFYSVVCARKGKGRHGQPVDPDRMMIRARDEDHLEALQERFPDQIGSCQIQKTAGTDYACRLFAPKSVWADILAQLANEMDYDNFKAEVARFQEAQGRAYAHSLHEVWTVMKEMQKSNS
jgi:hypothetical protein